LAFQCEQIIPVEFLLWHVKSSLESMIRKSV